MLKVRKGKDNNISQGIGNDGGDGTGAVVGGEWTRCIRAWEELCVLVLGGILQAEVTGGKISLTIFFPLFLLRYCHGGRANTFP